MAQVKDAAAAEDVIDRLIAEQPLMKPAVESSHGVVASGHPLASAAGALVLERGGNVVDAGIAVSFALGVVEPDASSIGGDGQAILFLNGMTEPIVIEYKDMTPSRATTDNPKLFNANGSRTAADGPTVANIPGVVAGLDLLYQKYGSKKVAWADLVAPAIKLADEGFVLDEALPTSIAEGRESFRRYPEAARVFLPGGRVPKPGERFVNKDYAETLRTLAKEGGQSFYRGTIARRIADDMAANGGVITLEDLAQYRAIERKPLAGSYRGHLVYSAPPPVPTGLQIVETLQILDNYLPRPGATYTTDADYFHYAIEAWRVRDGGARIADPERWPVDLGNHLEAPHALDRFKLIDPKKVYIAPAGGRGSPRCGDCPVGPVGLLEDLSRRVQTGTTAFVVADAQGNMIAFTQTLSTWGGNYYVSKGLGFIYNDHFRGGRGGTGFGAMLPLMRSASTSVPTLVFAPSPTDPGRYGIPGVVPRLAVGCAGNAWIPASVYDIILNVVDGGMTAQQAIEAPRFLIGGGPGGRSNVQIEDRFPRQLLADLESRGHGFTKVGRKGEVKYGYAAAAVVNTAKGTADGGADPADRTAPPPRAGRPRSAARVVGREVYRVSGDRTPNPSRETSNMRARKEQGFTLIELLIVVAIISIIAAIAVPGLLRAKMTGNETSAIISLKTTTVAQTAYSASCGSGAFASTFVILGTAPGGVGESFISADLGGNAAPVKSGYNFALGPGAGSAAGPLDCNGTATITNYLATGIPQTVNTTGGRSFSVNASNTIWQLRGGTPPAEPFTAPATPIQ